MPAPVGRWETKCSGHLCFPMSICLVTLSLFGRVSFRPAEMEARKKEKSPPPQERLPKTGFIVCNDTVSVRRERERGRERCGVATAEVKRLGLCLFFFIFFTQQSLSQHFPGAGKACLGAFSGYKVITLVCKKSSLKVHKERGTYIITVILLKVVAAY